MKWYALAMLGAITASTGSSSAATEEYARQSCLAHGALVEYLDRAYGEDRVATAELDTGNEVELFASRSGTWTLVEKRADGLGCVQASGTRMKVERPIHLARPEAPS